MPERRSTRRTRTTTAAGLCYLAVIAGGLFAQGVVRGPLVSSDFFARINPTILLPILVAELSLAVWLLLEGITVSAE